MSETDSNRHGPPSVINVGLMRTGTMSMARAYDILGLRAHHGLDMGDLPGRGSSQWAAIEEAAEWDAVFGSYDAVTDVGSLFADQLVEAYPSARVVIVQRDYDAWWESYRSEVADGMFSPATAVLGPVLALAGFRAALAMRKMLMGAFGARNLGEIKANARVTYFGYYDRIRELVPPERRLEYKLGDGWEPLCEFLGKEVPDVPFPRLNDRVQHGKYKKRELRAVTT
ncbi:hypothetical protein QBC33DRAFT_560806 [Phialemonium atrogriseum]|uniref:Sulfotransferase family protein n=1 Tax=Phialemonium atrogriseum TaxID=1093897 RepID=A0AAJ0C0I5_9PEZI|nr:uncharacterized protein QBC33DRAFT_560806 [Phialemonium atrogriseum]KAK1765441.1 hypothetical protein QBC33DRAFT_560806 [Phialemonium atrogriseum]